MKYYKQLLLNELSASGWELVEHEGDTGWWLEESWKVRSLRQKWGEIIYILFLVDPQYEGSNKSQAVWAVMAAKEIPNERPLNEGIITMGLTKGRYDINLIEFITSINNYRNETGL